MNGNGSKPGVTNLCRAAREVKPKQEVKKMFNTCIIRRSLRVLLSLPAAAALFAADTQLLRSFEATGGTVKFIATTNIGAISIHG